MGVFAQNASQSPFGFKFTWSCTIIKLLIPRGLFGWFEGRQGFLSIFVSLQEDSL